MRNIPQCSPCVSSSAVKRQLWRREASPGRQQTTTQCAEHPPSIRFACREELYIERCGERRPVPDRQQNNVQTPPPPPPPQFALRAEKSCREGAVEEGGQPWQTTDNNRMCRTSPQRSPRVSSSAVGKELRRREASPSSARSQGRSIDTEKHCYKAHTEASTTSPTHPHSSQLLNLLTALVPTGVAL